MLVCYVIKSVGVNNIPSSLICRTYLLLMLQFLLLLFLTFVSLKIILTILSFCVGNRCYIRENVVSVTHVIEVYVPSLKEVYVLCICLPSHQEHRLLKELFHPSKNNLHIYNKRLSSQRQRELYPLVNKPLSLSLGYLQVSVHLSK